jgi:hypothetical protein
MVFATLPPRHVAMLQQRRHRSDVIAAADDKRQDAISNPLARITILVSQTPGQQTSKPLA